jgi:large subunit ribosomal protein L17
MRHLKTGRILGRSPSHRKALLNNLVTSLVKHERVVTTLAKAKELRPKAEKMITLAKKGCLSSRRIALKSMKNKEALAKLFDKLGPRFSNRNGGYTRIFHLGQRNGDAAKIAILEWVELETKETRKAKETKDKKEAKGKKETKEKKKTKVNKEAKEAKETKDKKEVKVKKKKVAKK